MELNALIGVVTIEWLSPGVPMDDAEGPERYREAAKRLRELAEQTPVRDIQADLLSLAAYFDRMAVHLEAQHPSDASGDSGKT